MDKQYIYNIRVEGILLDRWADWFNGLAIQTETNGETCLYGPVADQAALLGILTKLQALNVTLISVNRLKLQE